MKILFLTSRPPFPVSGDRLRVRQQIAWLARTHDVRVLTLTSSADEEAQVPRLRAEGVQVEAIGRSRVDGAIGLASAIVSGEPLQAGYFDCGGMHAALTRTVRNDPPDVLYSHLVRTARYWHPQPPYAQVLDLCDALSQQYAERAALDGRGVGAAVDRVESRRLRTWERASLRRYDAVSIISAADAASIDPSAPPDVVPLHVQEYLDYEAPLPPPDNAEILFAGEMSTYYSVTAARVLVNEVMPMVWPRLPSATVKIVGANPSAHVRALGGPRVQVTGYVEDLRPWYARASAVACPIRIGTGLKTKVLQGMASRKPVIASTFANRGIHATDGEHLMLADDPASFADALVRVLTDSAFRQSLCVGAHRFVEQRFSETAMGARLDAFIARGLARAADRMRTAPVSAGASR